MSDLQCAATILLAPPGTAEPAPTPGDGPSGLTVEGRARARALAVSLHEARVAMIYCGDAPVAVQTAEIAAAPLGAHVRVRPALTATATADVARTAAELQEIADLHRGETVLVVAEAAGLAEAVSRLAGVRATGLLDGATVVEIAADADGWVVRSGSAPTAGGGNNVTPTAT